jgi:hypothetical protein
MGDLTPKDLPSGTGSSEVGLLVLVGAFCGLVIGAILGALVASGGGDLQSINDAAGMVVALICGVVGAVIGLGVGLGRRKSGSWLSEAPEDSAQPPYWPPPADWNPPIEPEGEADARHRVE